MKLKSNELEQHLLAGLLKFPQKYYEFSNFINEEDFVSNELNKVIFQIIRSLLEKNEPVDPVVISERIKQLGISFEESVTPFDYLQSLFLRKISEEGLIQTAKELKKISCARTIYTNLDRAKSHIQTSNPDKSIQDLITDVDKIYSSEIDALNSQTENPKNIFEDLEDFIEDRGENPVTDFGFMGPHERVNELYGSLLRAGNISVIVARAKAGKTSMALDFCTKVGAKYDVPILHLDNGEMSYRELQIRQCSALSGVAPHYLETGQWRQNKKMEEKVRAVWPKIKNMNFHYYNVGGLEVEEMINACRRFYFNTVGRGNKMILSFDYLKFRTQDAKSGDSWYVMGHMLDSFKTFIQKEITYNGEPQIALLTSVQANRSGIARNGEVEDNESIVGLSDMIGQLCSHLFILRKKTLEEIVEEGTTFGTHKLINVFSRHLGVNVHRALNPVLMPDGSKRDNFISLDFDNFFIKEKGDLIDLVDHLDITNAQPQS